MTKVRCAIYTRKSCEEGSSRSSIASMRSARPAPPISPARARGLAAVRDRYDDGGFSGGNMERPGLRRLLAECGGQGRYRGHLQDRPADPRLADFAKIVEIFEKAGAFVALPSPSTPPPAWGRLTLHVLLSFAQFEREVAAERIRDKIAASKPKGLWMGGTVPLGYEPSRGSWWSTRRKPGLFG